MRRLCNQLYKHPTGSFVEYQETQVLKLPQEDSFEAILEIWLAVL